MSDLIVITPTWSWERYLDLRTERIDQTQSVHDVVMWSGAPVPDDSGQTQNGLILGPSTQKIDLRTEPPDDPFYARTHLLANPVRLSPVEGMWLGAHYAMLQLPRGYLAFIHDDVHIYSDGWDQRVLEFMDAHPSCGLLGFGGALGLGTDQIYKEPFSIPQLVRIHYMSNADDWFQHGDLLQRTRQVSVLDGLTLIFRREAYLAMGTWQECLQHRIPFHMYDAWACLRMRQLGWEVWAIPIAFHHDGGGTSVQQSAEFEKVAQRLQFKGAQELYDVAHEEIWREFRDVLPARVHG